LHDVEKRNAFMARAPFHQWLSCHITVHDAASGAPSIALPARPERHYSPDREKVHGGITTALINLAAHAALNRTQVSPPVSFSTTSTPCLPETRQAKRLKSSTAMSTTW